VGNKICVICGKKEQPTDRAYRP